jgi:hypothetical protein
MLGVLLDGAVMWTVLYVLSEGEITFFNALWVAFVVAFPMTLVVVFLGPTLGLMAVVPIAGLAWLLTMLGTQLSPKHSAIAAAIFLVYKAIMIGLFYFLLK